MGILNRFWRKGKRLLRNLDISSIALAGIPATGHSFSVVKGKDKGLAVKILEFLDAEEDKKELSEIAGKLPDDVKIEFEKNLKIIVDQEDILPPDLFAVARDLVGESLASAALGPPENKARLVALEKTISTYQDDLDEETEGAIEFFRALQKSGLPDIDYGDLEEEVEDPEEGRRYVSRFSADHVPGDKVLTVEEALELAKTKETPLFPSLQVQEEDTVTYGKNRKYVGRPIFKSEEEDPEEDELTPAEEIALLKTEIKNLKKPKSLQILSDDVDPEEIEKGDEEFIWSSLITE